MPNLRRRAVEAWLNRLALVGRAYVRQVQVAPLLEGRLDLGSLPKAARVVAVLALAIVILTLLATVYVATGGAAGLALTYTPDGTTYEVPTLSFYLGASVYTLGWALLLAGAAHTNPIVFGLTALYFVYYFGAFGFPLAEVRSPAFAIPAFVAATWSLVAARKAAGRPAAPVALGLMLAYPAMAVVVLAAYPLRLLVPTLGWRVAAGLTLGLVAALVVTRLRPTFPRTATTVMAALLTGPLLALFVASAVSSARSPSDALASAVLAFDVILPLITICWFFLGARTLEMAGTVTDWAVHSAKLLFPGRAFVVLCVALWTTELAAAAAISPWWSPLGALSRHLPPAMALTVDTHYPVAALLVLVAIALYAARRPMERGLRLLLGIWVVSFLLVYAFFSNFLEVGGVGEQLQPLTLGVLVAGLLWDLHTGGAVLSHTGSPWLPRFGRLFLYLGVLLVVAGISHLELAAQLPAFNRQVALTSFDGMLYLGLPLLAYSLAVRQRWLPLPPARTFLGAFGTGALVSLAGHLLTAGGALTGLAVDLIGPLAIALQSGLKVGALLTARRLSTALQHPVHLLAAAAALGLGSATLAAHPVVLIPFVPPAWQGLTTSAPDWPRVASVYGGHIGEAALLGAGLSLLWHHDARVPLRLGRWPLIMVAVALGGAFRCVYDKGFGEWEAVLNSTGLLWFYVELPLAMLAVALLWRSMRMIPRLRAARAAIWRGLAALALAQLLIAGWLWHQGRMVPYPLPGERLVIEYPATWHAVAPGGDESASFERFFAFGKAQAFLGAEPVPPGVSVEDYVAAKEAALGGAIELLARQEKDTGHLAVQKRDYRLAGIGPDGVTREVRAMGYYFLLDGRAYVLSGFTSGGYSRELGWDMERMLRSIRRS